MIQSGKRSYKLTPDILQTYLGERGRRGKKLPRGFRSVDRVALEFPAAGEEPAKPPAQATFENF